MSVRVVDKVSGALPADVGLSVGIKTLGCRLNQFESDGILARFVAAGYALVDFDSGPDIAIINTCTVTDQADARNRNAVRRAIRNNPDARVVVTGCFAQTDPEVLKEIDGVAMVIGNDRKSALFDLVHARIQSVSHWNAGRAPLPWTNEAHGHTARGGGLGHPTEGLPLLESPFAYAEAIPVGHTRAYLKIQDGCDRKCSYCKIPQARGKGVSRPMEDILEHAARLEAAGVPEIVVTGVNLGWYRDPLTKTRLNGLLRRLVGSLRKARLRLSSIEPPDVNVELADIMAHPRFCRFVHMPVQSGSARILRQMRRTYNPRSFRLRAEAVRAALPDVSLGTDVIVGFPGETDADFAATLELLGVLDFANIHPFRFSPRAGTAAARLAGRVPEAVVRARMDRLLQLRDAGRRAYAGRFLGTAREVVVEEERPSGILRGTTDNFLHVSFQQGSERSTPRGALVRIRLDGLDESGSLWGTLT